MNFFKNLCFYVTILTGFYLLWPSASGLSSTGTSGPSGWLAFGDLRGYLETCGCDPSTDMGGVARIAKLLAREKSANQDIQVFDLGNNFDLPPHPDIKAKYIGKALSRMPVDAALLNRIEFSYDLATLGNRPFVLSNLVKQKSLRLPRVSEVIETSQSIIFGYLWVSDSKLSLQGFDERLLKKWKARRVKSKSKKSILLINAPDSHLKQISSTGLFDLIISSNQAPDSVQPGFEERNQPEKLNHPASGGKVRMVPLGGVGVLRGGRARKEEAPSLAKLLDPGEGISQKGENPGLFGASGNHGPMGLSQALADIPVTWLSPEWEGGSPLNDLMEAYRVEARGSFQKIAMARIPDLKNSPFAGAPQCKSCHEKAWATWSGSSHAHALETLKKQRKNEDAECVSCHVLGWKEKGGFANEKESPHFAGVQCETCHGAGKKHSLNPMEMKLPTPRPSAEFCTSCHHTPHSPSFKFNEYWNKIKHGKEF